jgi:hypothetical protein
MMQARESMGLGGKLLALLVALVIVCAFFYGLDHLVMGMQGLPLNADLSPAG